MRIIRWKRGEGDALAGVAVIFFMMTIFMILAGFLQFMAASTQLCKAVETVGRSVAVCKKEADAPGRAQNVAEAILTNNGITDPHAEITLLKGDSWKTGTVARVDLTASIKTLIPALKFTDVRKSCIVTLEGDSVYATEFSGTGDAATLINYAMQFLGTPYVWGGYSPSGFDCSGFVSYCLTNSGLLNTGRMDTTGLLSISTRVSKEQLQPGDLVFFQGTYRTGLSHVGIFMGSGQYGSGTFIHCGDPCQFGDLNSAYWIEHWLTGGRVLS